MKKKFQLLVLFQGISDLVELGTKRPKKSIREKYHFFTYSTYFNNIRQGYIIKKRFPSLYAVDRLQKLVRLWQHHLHSLKRQNTADKESSVNDVTHLDNLETPTGRPSFVTLFTTKAHCRRKILDSLSLDVIYGRPLNKPKLKKPRK